jgi:hypothetical protein
MGLKIRVWLRRKIYQEDLVENEDDIPGEDEGLDEE